MIKVLIADDQASIRQGLRMQFALEPDFLVVGEARNGQEAVELAEELHPDVVVMDVYMPVLDGFAACKALHEHLPDCMVVALSLHGDPLTRLEAKECGCAAFVEKQGGTQLLFSAIRQVTARGQN